MQTYIILFKFSILNGAFYQVRWGILILEGSYLPRW